MLTEQPNWLMQRAQLTPERIALIYEDQTVTFAELFAASKRMSAQLAAHSVRKGDTAAIFAPKPCGNGIRHSRLFFAWC